LKRLQQEYPVIVGIVTEIPKELGLFTWEVVSVDEPPVMSKLLKVWIVPTARERNGEEEEDNNDDD
jgi:hypothetical protein